MSALATVSSPAHAAPGQIAPADPRFGAVEAYRDPSSAAELQLGWERALFQWMYLQPKGAQDWNEASFDDKWLAEAQSHGRELVGLIESTPAWATDGLPNAGVPRGLYLPVTDPRNLWAGFVRKTVKRYAGRIDHWIIWNEPDIAKDTYGVQWTGSVADFVRLMKVAYLVAKQENPGAVIHLPGLTYWHDVVRGQPQYLQRYIEEARKDPEAAGHNLYFDVASLHVYFSTDSVYDITSTFSRILHENQLAQPIWINETNAAPYDDPANPWTIPDWKVTLEQQAGFIIQAFAQGLAAGAERIEVYKLRDYPANRPGFEPYGLIRADGTRRPAFEALRTIVSYAAGTQKGGLDRDDARTIVSLDRGEKLTRVLWARGKGNVELSLPAKAAEALLVLPSGKTQAIAADGGAYALTLPGALCNDPAHGCALGGTPLVVVEDLPPPRPEEPEAPG